MSKSLVTGFAHVGVRVHELARARAFYERFGFEFVVGPIGPEPVAIMEHPSGVEINFVLNAAIATESNILMDVEVKHAGYTHIALSVTSVDEVVAFCEAEGIAISGGPVDYPHGARGVFVRDPDRNVLELYQPPAA